MYSIWWIILANDLNIAFQLCILGISENQLCQVGCPLHGRHACTPPFSYAYNKWYLNSSSSSSNGGLKSVFCRRRADTGNSKLFQVLRLGDESVHVHLTASAFTGVWSFPWKKTKEKTSQQALTRYWRSEALTHWRQFQALTHYCWFAEKPQPLKNTARQNSPSSWSNLPRTKLIPIHA